MKFQVSTRGDKDVQSLTERVESVLDDQTGLCNVFARHTTAGVTVNEAEGRLMEDMEEVFADIVPEKDFRHDEIDGNADSHLAQTVIGSEVTVPVENGSLKLGTWQDVLLIELDGPRTREVEVTVLEK